MSYACPTCDGAGYLLSAAEIAEEAVEDALHERRMKLGFNCSHVDGTLSRSEPWPNRPIDESYDWRGEPHAPSTFGAGGRSFVPGLGDTP